MDTKPATSVEQVRCFTGLAFLNNKNIFNRYESNNVGIHKPS